MSFQTKPLILFFTAGLLVFPSPGRAETSKLWGDAGELWTTTSRLPDFSFAGYQSSRKPIPDLTPVKNVKDFGAKGDGRTDDTEAFLEAIESGLKGALFIPEGRYKIMQPLRIERRGLVLQGAGRGKTVLVFPIPLEKSVGPGKDYAPSGSWSWDGGYIWFQGDNRSVDLSEVTAPARRGATTFRVDDPEKFYPGQRVRLVMVDTDGSLGRHLYGEKMAGSKLMVNHTAVDFSCSIVAVNINYITIDRPVRTDVRLHWKPIFATDAPTVEEVGVEKLTIEFPVTHYAGHHDEPGYNGITFQSVSNGWVRDVEIINSDCGIVFRSNSKFCTVQGLLLRADQGRERGGWEAHHGVEIGDMSQDNLITNFQITSRIIHTFSVTSMASGNVFMKGTGTDISFDHHRKAPNENLYTQINVGRGSDLWMSGGDEDAGPFSGARETVWNVTSETPLTLPDYAVLWNVIGMTGNLSAESKENGNWIEPISPLALTPPNLFESQLAHRLAKSKTPAKGTGHDKK